MANTNTYQAQANELSQKLWAIANELRGQMDASEFKNYILGVIFYRYLSERTEMYMAEILENDGVTYEEAFADDDYRPVVEEWSLTKLGYVIRPENLFRNLIRKITKFESEADRFSVEDFEKAINDLVGSTMGHESNKAFDGLFNDMGTILRDKSNRNINYNKTNLDSYKAMKKGDFIIHLRSFEGGLECSNYDGISSPAYKILRTNKLIPEAYKGYFRTYNFIEGKLSAAVVGIRDGKNIDMPTFWEIELNVPSLPEQQKIAEFLSTVDRVIEKQKETITTWKERKKGVMQKLFSQEVRFKANDGSEFPEWEEKKIDDIATCFAGATPSTKIPEYWDNGTIQWMSSGEVNNGQIYETEKRISQLGFDKCSTKMVKPNTVVMALAGQGKTRGMVAITRVPLCTNQSLCAIETNDDICDDYLYQYLQTQYNNLRLISSGDGTRGGLNLKLVGGYVVSMPCFIEQQKIVACLSALDDVIEKKKATLAAWEELKKGLLQQMFV